MRITLRIAGEPLTVEAPEPPAQARLDELLPFLRRIDNAVIDRMVQRTESAGETISCRRGCSACCRAQPVPISPPEAYALWLLVQQFPAERREAIRARFAANVAQLTAAGLVDPYLNRDPALDEAGARRLAEQYMDLKLTCPFLEDDACGIYEDRPFVCRQYLVTSPAELCADPLNQPVKPIPIPIAPTRATLAVAKATYGRPQHSIPLALAMVYAERHRAELERRTESQALARTWIAQF